MKIMSWNCNGSFRDSIKEINRKDSKLYVDADIYVICECENPNEPLAKYEEYKELVGNNYYWIGDLHYKGLGVFAKEDVDLKEIETNGNFEFFKALRVNDSFNLLAVWAQDKDKEKRLNPYVEMIHDFYDANTELFDENLIICGDFNSSTHFNNKHKSKDDDGNPKNHTNLDIKLNNNGLYSIYHTLSNEENGKETKQTFYQARHLNHYFHLDYVYACKEIIDETTLIENGKRTSEELHNTYEILDYYEWTCLSDHLPIVFEIEN